MNTVQNILLENIDNPNACFIFPTDTAASRWADYLLRMRGGSIAMNKFIAWDKFKQKSVKSKVQNKKSIPSALRKIFISCIIKENDYCANDLKNTKPVFSSLIRPQWADLASHFAPWLTRILPQLGVWYKKTTGLEIQNIAHDIKTAEKLEGDDKDLFVLARRYALFLEEHGLFEPAWEVPPFNNEGHECFIFFPESLSDYSEYKELLEASEHVKIISVCNDISGNKNIKSDTFFYTNSRSEITESALYIRALHERFGINWDAIALCLPDSESYEAYIFRELKNRNIPFVKRTSKPLTDYSAGLFFSAIVNCISQDFAFQSLASLLLNRNLPWKDTEQINILIEFGIRNNCISSWIEKKDGEEASVNVWEDAFNCPFGGIDKNSRQFFSELKKRLRAFRSAESFSEMRKQYFIFRERFFDMEKCSQETDLILSRCITELMGLVQIEKDYPGVCALSSDTLQNSSFQDGANLSSVNSFSIDPFLFFIEYLSEVNYLEQTENSGINILPYKTAAAAPFDCHIVLGCSQDNLSVIYSRLDFLPRKKLETLGIFDEDASGAFIEMHKYNSLKFSAFFCSEQTFKGFAVPHSKINAPLKPIDRYAKEEEKNLFFSPDYYAANNSTLLKLHENQIEGFKKWKERREAEAQNTKTQAGKTLQKLISEKFTRDTDIPGKYSVSSSSMSSYYQCSLKWIYERVLKLENIQVEAGLMAENITGIVYHAVLNLFLTKIKEKKAPLEKPVVSAYEIILPPDYKKLLCNCVDTLFNSFPFMQPDSSQMSAAQMSALTARILKACKSDIQFRLEKCLARFLSLFAGCRVASCEASYKNERADFFLNGKIDCLLEKPEKNNENKYIIVDFKLKYTPRRDECTGSEGSELSDFQLPMYITLAEENEKIKVETALFYSILELKPEVIIGFVEDTQTETIIPKKEEDRILNNSENYNNIICEFNKKAEQFASEISSGKFTVFESEYSKCNECNYKRICRTVYVICGEKRKL